MAHRCQNPPVRQHSTSWILNHTFTLVQVGFKILNTEVVFDLCICRGIRSLEIVYDYILILKRVGVLKKNLAYFQIQNIRK
jgi:hypothetical protein